MNTRHRLGWTAILLMSAMVLGGCGFFGDDTSVPEPDDVNYPVNTGVRQTMELMRGMSSVYDIYTVNPNQGFLPGGEQIHLSGFFPAVAGAESITPYISDSIRRRMHPSLRPIVFTIYMSLPLPATRWDS